MADDGELLRRYADEGSEEAFAELVHRHLDLVYAAAVRQLHDPHRAKDVVQVVFASLARQAKALSKRPALLSWLYTAVHYMAANEKRAEWRRQVREREAMTLGTDSGGTPAREHGWDRLRPVLDDAMHDLAEGDREAVLLRFFQGLTFAEIARPLRVSEDGARKRVDRALEKLRGSLARRGITSTPAALAAALSGQPTIAAPAELGSTIVGGALTGAKVAAGISKTFAMTILQKSIVASVIAVAIGAGVYETQIVTRQNATIRELERKAAAAGRRATEAGRAAADAQSPATIGSLPDSGAVEASVPVDGVLATRVGKLRDWLNRMPERGIPELGLLTDADWLRVIQAHDSPLDTEDEAREMLEGARLLAKMRLVPRMLQALHAFADANEGRLPPDTQSMAPFFDPPIDSAILDRYAMLQSGPLPDDSIPAAGLRIGDTVAALPKFQGFVGERREAIVDDQYDSLFQVSGTRSNIEFTNATEKALAVAADGYAAANNGEKPTTVEQLQPFLAAPVATERIESFLKTPNAQARLWIGLMALPGSGMGRSGASPVGLR